MKALAEGLFKLYGKAEDGIFGFADAPCSFWMEFNRRSHAYAFEMLEEHLPAEHHATIGRLIGGGLTDWSAEHILLLHGDAGVHNFVFERGAIRGVIDPSPVRGPLVYDFTYAFCSSPDNLNLETLLEAARPLNGLEMDRETLIRETVFQLYCRLATCRLHHVHDWDDYMRVWPGWLALLPDGPAQ